MSPASGSLLPAPFEKPFSYYKALNSKVRESNGKISPVVHYVPFNFTSGTEEITTECVQRPTEYSRLN